jgi:hypothetical protein
MATWPSSPASHGQTVRQPGVQPVAVQGPAPLIGADSNSQQKARGGASKQPAGKVLPVEEFRTERWRAMDADVTFAGKRIVHSEQLPFNDLAAHVILDDGLLRLEPLRFGVAGGNLDSNIRLDGRSTPLQGVPGSPPGASSSSSCSPVSRRCRPALANSTAMPTSRPRQLGGGVARHPMATCAC